ncbi:Putative glutathione-specific gamma-glutamylcyclotransferase 2 [Vanrija pseudolonga]|uniref:glutathione-specific gamma-glutamylcyclotransferase n=1 Tax=Vanrija pseudolonga TaxID=143232 RepID=A0AAF0YFS9_9TREE|nr:Putative glutathione-specific gamma-glutamylcyclotransferase 2 [Vanrija pseudolonga]
MTVGKEYWVFGYGSLIWKPPPHTVEQRPGYVKGVVRRFAQSSNDHRGTPENPGRVVTVINAADWHRLAKGDPHADDEDLVWGVAYRIDPAKEEEVRAYLEYREKNGYTSHDVPVYHTTEDGTEAIAVPESTIWIGNLDNEAFVGYEPLDVVADLIHVRHGPSGPNKEYLYRLAEAVRQLYPHVKDPYLFELDRAVKSREAAAQA